MNYSG
jgi:hypothetical protein